MRGLSFAAQQAVRRLVDDLVAGNFDSIERDGRIGRLSRGELKRAIAQYGRTLVGLPRGGMDEVDVYPSESVAGQFAVDVRLWTAEEGRSDLTLSVTVVETGGAATVSIDDLHTL